MIPNRASMSSSNWTARKLASTRIRCAPSRSCKPFASPLQSPPCAGFVVSDDQKAVGRRNPAPTPILWRTLSRPCVLGQRGPYERRTMKVLMLHGITHNLFGKREPIRYGGITLEQIDARLLNLARE